MPLGKSATVITVMTVTAPVCAFSRHVEEVKCLTFTHAYPVKTYTH